MLADLGVDRRDRLIDRAALGQFRQLHDNGGIHLVGEKTVIHAGNSGDPIREVTPNGLTAKIVVSRGVGHTLSRWQIGGKCTLPDKDFLVEIHILAPNRSEEINRGVL